MPRFMSKVHDPAQSFVLRSYTMHGYVTSTFLLVRSSVWSKQLLCFVQGQGHPRRPWATSWDDAIVLGESLLQELKSPWELILTEQVPEKVEFHHADWAEKYFSAQSAMSSSRVSLSPSYTR